MYFNSKIHKLTNKGTGIIYKIRCNVIVRPCFKTYYSIFGSRLKLRLENLAVCRFSVHYNDRDLYFAH